MNPFLSFLKELTFFALAARVIVQMRPREAYEKYLRLLVGIMTLEVVVEYLLREGRVWMQKLF